MRANEFLLEDVSNKLGPQLYVPHPKKVKENFLKPTAKLWTSTAVKTPKGYTSDWVESEVTWNNRKSGTAWTTAGGDYDSFVENYTTSISGYALFYFNLTNLVNKWLKEENYFITQKSKKEEYEEIPF